MMRRALLVLFVWLVGATGLMAWQARPFGVVDFGADGAMGYRFPFVGIGAGVDVQAGRMLIQGEGLYSATGKINYGKVRQFYGQTRAMYVAGHLVVGGGATFSHIVFRDFGDRRSALRPFATIGARFRDTLLTLDSVFPGSDPAYRVYKGIFRVDVRCFRHIRAAFDLTGVTLRNTAGNFQNSGITSDLCIKLLP